MSSNVKTNSFRAWLLAARPKTLSAALVPVAIANALAFVCQGQEGLSFSWGILVTTVLFAMVMQIMANFINDYVDFKRGTDDEERIGPERACAMGWITERAMRWGIGVTLVLSAVVGLSAVGIHYAMFAAVPWPLFVIGALCMVFAFLYSTYCSYHALGDALVLVFFGFVPVVCTYYLHTARWDADALWIIALGCGAAMCTLLTVNNIRDRHQDRQHHKRTIVVLAGERFGFWLYELYGLVASLCQLALLQLYASLGVAIVLSCITFVLNALAYWKICKIHDGVRLNKMLAVTSLILIYYGVSTVVALLI